MEKAKAVTIPASNEIETEPVAPEPIDYSEIDYQFTGSNITYKIKITEVITEVKKDAFTKTE